MQGGLQTSALQLASYEGHETIVKLLLNNGADINLQGGTYGSALQIASYKGHEAIVNLLLDNGADMNLLGGAYTMMTRHQLHQLFCMYDEVDVDAYSDAYSSLRVETGSSKSYEAKDLLLAEEKEGADMNLLGGAYTMMTGHQLHQLSCMYDDVDVDAYSDADSSLQVETGSSKSYEAKDLLSEKKEDIIGMVKVGDMIQDMIQMIESTLESFTESPLEEIQAPES